MLPKPMTNRDGRGTEPEQPLKNNPIIVGQPVLVVIDIQQAGFLAGRSSGITHMADLPTNLRRARTVIDAARATDVPVVFLQEAHRASRVDFGRELDGDEDEHCVEGWPGTEVAAEVVGLRPDDYVIKKRRYSGFIGTDLEILLRGLKAETLILVGAQELSHEEAAAVCNVPVGTMKARLSRARSALAAAVEKAERAA